MNDLLRAGHTQTQTQSPAPPAQEVGARCPSGGGGVAQRFGLTTFVSAEACDTREQPIELSTHLKCVIRVDTFDYHGSPRISGGDPIAVEMQWMPPPPPPVSPTPTSTRTSSSSLNTLAGSSGSQLQGSRATLQPTGAPAAGAPVSRSPTLEEEPDADAGAEVDELDAEVCDLQVMDNQDGSYLVHVTPERAGIYRLSISIVRTYCTHEFCTQFICHASSADPRLTCLRSARALPPELQHS